MVRCGDRVMVGTSGGPDSVALLYVLWRLAPELKVELHVAHLNHMFRGEEAEEDALSVASLALRLALPLTVEAFDVPEFVGRSGLSQEDGARRVRYGFLHRAAALYRAHKIALGHNADDLAETVLMRLLWGSGTSGLRGIPPVNRKVIRPLIEEGRREIESYLKENDLSSRLDSTNLKPLYLRNRIRLHLLPLLRNQYNPNVTRALTDAASILRDEDLYLSSVVDKLLPTLSERRGGDVVLKVPGYLGCERALRRRILREILFRLRGDLRPMGFYHIERLHDFISRSQRGATMRLPGGLVVERGAEGVHFYPTPLPQAPMAVPLPVPGEAELPTLGLSIRATLERTHEGADMASFIKEAKGGANVAYVDHCKVQFPLSVVNRPSLAGLMVRFQPLGMAGSKSLKEYFMDRKIARRERDRIPLVMGGGEVIWVGGHQISEAVRLDEDTRVVLKLTLGPV